LRDDFSVNAEIARSNRLNCQQHCVAKKQMIDDPLTEFDRWVSSSALRVFEIPDLTYWKFPLNHHTSAQTDQIAHSNIEHHRLLYSSSVTRMARTVQLQAEVISRLERENNGLRKALNLEMGSRIISDS
jgi:hypothetical protein